jgi:hypothetical protein
VKRQAYFLVFLLLLAILAGWLISHLNFIGRLGVNLVHREYQFLRSWWKAASLVGIIWLILWSVHAVVAQRASRGRNNLVNFVSLLVAALGLYFTYRDFRTDFTHRIIGERFHLGAYLFWVGWGIIAIWSAISYVDKAKTRNGL